MKVKIRESRLALISLFLALEVVLFIALDFGNIGTVFKGLAFILAAILAPFFFEEMKLDLGQGLYVLLMPILFYALVTMVAPAYGSYPEMYLNEVFMQLSFITRLINLLGVVSLLLLGYFIGKSEVFATKHIFIVVLAGLAAPVLVSLFATLINYGFFHPLVYKNLVTYYSGQEYDVASQASLLYGFRIMVGDLKALASMAVIIASAGLGLLFLNEQKDKFTIISLAIISAIGLLTLILTASFAALIYLLPALIFALLLKFDLLKKLKNKVTLGVVLGLVAIGTLIFLLTAYNVFNLQVVWQTNRITRKLFFNGYMQRFYIVFKEAVGFRNLYGYFVMTLNGNKIFPTGNFLFDVMWMDGLIGFLALFAFLVIFVMRLVKYFNKDKDDKILKVVLISVLLTAFFRFMLRYPFNIFTYEDFRAINYFPIINSPIFLLIVFIAGCVFVVKEEHKDEEEVTHEEK
ncbi:MAG: hypothetical protein BWX74_00602 [Tenericutes bacterium ADurb.Bin087]|nr:MAG: hypothetical protein BWX74_00602 [Tenericutes bacterium ADurb.Bin087]